MSERETLFPAVPQDAAPQFVRHHVVQFSTGLASAEVLKRVVETHRNGVVALSAARETLWDALHRRWHWAGRHAIYAKWLGWKYRAPIAVKRHKNVDGERVPGWIVSVGVAYAEWF